MIFNIWKIEKLKNKRWLNNVNANNIIRLVKKLLSIIRWHKKTNFNKWLKKISTLDYWWLIIN